VCGCAGKIPAEESGTFDCDAQDILKYILDQEVEKIRKAEVAKYSYFGYSIAVRFVGKGAYEVGPCRLPERIWQKASCYKPITIGSSVFFAEVTYMYNGRKLNG
jgi:hypothetical protein